MNFRNQRLWHHNCRTLKVTGSHVMYDRGAWFLRVIMSSSRALCCLPLVKKQKHDFNFFAIQCIIKQFLDSVFVISRTIEVSVRVISLSLQLRLITPTRTSIILDITKTSSNNCLIQHLVFGGSGRKGKRVPSFSGEYYKETFAIKLSSRLSRF